MLYDTTPIAMFVSLVLAIAALGAALVVGVLARNLISVWRARPATPATPKAIRPRLVFHH
ncbi:MAG TPA: hypothetical protein VFM08_16045 [Nocardioides sp.]|jgi:hypothetical protein|nr:hypothetical protein [Nocardioides sp.]